MLGGFPAPIPAPATGLLHPAMARTRRWPQAVIDLTDLGLSSLAWQRKIRATMRSPSQDASS